MFDVVRCRQDDLCTSVCVYVCSGLTKRLHVCSGHLGGALKYEILHTLLRFTYALQWGAAVSPSSMASTCVKVKLWLISPLLLITSV